MTLIFIHYTTHKRIHEIHDAPIPRDDDFVIVNHTAYRTVSCDYDYDKKIVEIQLKPI